MISYNFEYYFVFYRIFDKDINDFEYFQLFTILFRSISIVLLHEIK